MLLTLKLMTKFNRLYCDSMSMECSFQISYYARVSPSHGGQSRQ